MKSQSPTRFAVLLAMLITVCSFAPRALKADDWPPVSPEELALKDNPASPGEDAMILYRENVIDATNLRVDGDSDTEYFRIKIFTQAGTKHADVQIPFLKESMNIVDVAGRTIHPDGTIVKFDGKVLETTITRLSGFKFLAKTFTLPDVQPGSIIEYRYRKQGRPEYLHDLSWDVSQDIFTREAHFTMKPYPGPTGYFPYYRPYLLPESAAPKQEGRSNVFTMVVHDIPAITDEPLMPSERTLESRVEFYYRNDISNDPPEKFWAKQAKKWNEEFEHFIDKKDVLRAEVAKVVSANDSAETKLEKLYARAQQIRNLDYENTKSEQELKTENIKPNANVADVLSHGYGHGRDVNFLFAGLVRAAGFEAVELRIAPVTEQIFTPESEDESQLDDDLLWVRADSKEYYADPAARFFPFGLLPWYEQGARGLRVDNSSISVTTPQRTEADAQIIRNADVSFGADGTTTGKLFIDFVGQEAAIRRGTNSREDDAGRKRNLQNEIKDWLPAGSQFEITSNGPWDDNTKPLHVEGTITVSGLTAPTGSRILVPIELFAGRYSGTFASQKRVNSIDFRYPFEEIDDIKMTPPPGYSVASLPMPGKIGAGAAIYSIEATKQGDGLEVKRQFAIKGTLFEVKYYSTIRTIFLTVKGDDNAQVILQSKLASNNN